MPGMGGMASLPTLTWMSLVTTWELHPFVLALVVVAAAGYGTLVVRVRRLGQRWPRRYRAAWLFGLAIVVVCSQGGIAVYGHVLFWVHMIGHLLLIMVAPLLLVLGAPLSLLVAAARPEAREAVERRLVRGPIAAITNPALGLIAYTVTIVATHLTGFMDAVMIHPWLEAVEQLLYLVAGFWFFLPLVGSEPVRWRLGAPQRMFVLALSMPVDTFTGVVLLQTSSYPWPAMAAMHQPWASSPLDDLHAGGAVMWIGGDAIMAVIFALVFVRWARFSRTANLGGWLEGVRLHALRETVGLDAATAIGDAATADTDECLDAYNAYLGRLSEPQIPDSR